MKPGNIPPKRKKGHRLSARRDWNPIVEAVRTLAGGETNPDNEVTDNFICKIIDTGPLGTEPDYSDSRYWVQRQYVALTTSDNTASLSDAFSDFGSTTSDGVPTSDYIFTATNLGELETKTHNKSVGDFVHVHKVLDKSSTPHFHYYFDSPQVVGNIWTAEVSECFNIEGNVWTSFKTDGWIATVTARPHYGDGSLDSETVLYLKATDFPSDNLGGGSDVSVGFTSMLAGDVIGYVINPNGEEIPGIANSDYNGWILPHGGKEGATFDSMYEILGYEGITIASDIGTPWPNRFLRPRIKADPDLSGGLEWNENPVTSDSKFKVKAGYGLDIDHSNKGGLYVVAGDGLETVNDEVHVILSDQALDFTINHELYLKENVEKGLKTDVNGLYVNADTTNGPLFFDANNDFKLDVAVSDGLKVSDGGLMVDIEPNGPLCFTGGHLDVGVTDDTDNFISFDSTGDLQALVSGINLSHNNVPNSDAIIHTTPGPEAYTDSNIHGWSMDANGHMRWILVGAGQYKGPAPP